MGAPEYYGVLSQSLRLRASALALRALIRNRYSKICNEEKIQCEKSVI